MNIDIWSDIGCPFCYLGTTQLNQALAAFEHKHSVQVTHHSFQLDPDAPLETKQSLNEMLADKKGFSVERAESLNQQVAGMFAAAGLTMNYKDALPVNTFDAHRLAHFAATHGKQEEMLARLFKAYFTDGLNTADTETLVKLAGEAGLDAEEARAALASDQFAAEVQADITRAAQLGIHGVPFFVFEGKYAVSGAQGTGAFRQVLQQVWMELHPQAV
ncbi:MAG: DsbA family oxidoreductase [Anaerolineales bacterium]|nr:DsbA family oxidoreductase [Anaerolineales bacterium]